MVNCSYCKQVGHMILDKMQQISCPLLIKKNRTNMQINKARTMYAPQYVPQSLYPPHPPQIQQYAAQQPHPVYAPQQTHQTQYAQQPLYPPQSQYPLQMQQYAPQMQYVAYINPFLQTVYHQGCCELCIYGINHTRVNNLPFEMLGQYKCYCCACVRIFIDNLQIKHFAALEVKKKKINKMSAKKTCIAVPKLQTIYEIDELHLC